MNYERPELLDRLASEYAFGCLTARARRRFERLRKVSPTADAAARAWEARIAPLSASVPPVAPPPRIWSAIDARTGGAAAKVRDGGFWRFLKPALGFAFGALAVITVVRYDPDLVVPIDEVVQRRGTLPQSYVGLLTDAEGKPVVLASSTRHGRRLSLKLINPLDIPAGRTAVLWALPKDAAPFPVGIVPAQGKGEIALADDAEKLFANVPRLGVAFEPGLPQPGAAPSPFVAAGNCVKLW